ncbi:MAG: T9SS type A sorting domain-containing protein [Flavobacteriales bacterium]|nr:T9SS type A sorting domain-containing protein [Flavobacteriales bacterium]
MSDADTDGDLTADCNDGCPADPNKIAPGICGCGNADTDTDGDGTADCVDPCPALANVLPGDPCNDNNACTINDVLNAGCVCAGTFQDTDGDGVCDANDSCPSVAGQVGSACNDNNASTINDVLNASCQCVGTPVGGPCTQNEVTLTLTTDGNASQLNWYVMLTGTNTAVCSGNGLANNSTIVVNCCLGNGCCDLVIADSFGDGILGGGYVLRDASNNRIVDNAGNGSNFTTLSLSHLGFCVPLSSDALVAGSCDVETATILTVLQAQSSAAVTAQYGVNNANSGYQFWVTNPHGGYSRRILFTHSSPGTGAPTGTAPALKASYFLPSSIDVPPPLIPRGILLNVRVRTRVNGVFGNFGPACRLMIPTPPCGITQLTTMASPVVSCGATGLTFSSTIYAHPVAGATNYQFEFSRSGYLRRINQPMRSTTLSFVTNPLQNNTCYNVRVRVSVDNGVTYCPFGPMCNITIGTAACSSAIPMNGSDASAVASEDVRLMVWPNPALGQQVSLTFTGLDDWTGTVHITLVDATGKVASTEQLFLTSAQRTIPMDIPQDMPPGLYLLNAQIGDRVLHERLVLSR